MLGELGTAGPGVHDRHFAAASTEDGFCGRLVRDDLLPCSKGAVSSASRCDSRLHPGVTHCDWIKAMRMRVKVERRCSAKPSSMLSASATTRGGLDALFILLSSPTVRKAIRTDWASPESLRSELSGCQSRVSWGYPESGVVGSTHGMAIPETRKWKRGH